MDINKAYLILSNWVSSKTEPIDAVKLAMDILTNNFQAEFTARDEAVSSLSKEKIEHEETQKKLSETDDELVQAQRGWAETQTEKDARIAELEAEVEALKNPTPDEPSVESEVTPE